ncbi:MAG: MBL fold metallo-hydrolase [Candidatus Aceula lacicola]|nr:MBL fold metallo-hydrolase [Candidatus Aceula lacicola]
MQIKILFDNETVGSDFQAGIGFSCLLREDVLFDVGAEDVSLRKNIETFGIDVSLIKHIVISHDHWDHIGGLWWILEKTKEVTVYICPGFSKDFIDKLSSTHANIIQCAAPQPVVGNILTTGQMECQYKDKPIFEQSVILKGSQSVSVITGCAHPGIVEILRKVKASFPKDSIDLVLGGFHLSYHFNDDIESIIKNFRTLGVKRVGPAHCTGGSAQRFFKESYQENCLDVKTGCMFDI